VLCLDEVQVADIDLSAAVWCVSGMLASTSNRAPEELYERGMNRDLFLPLVRELEWRSGVWRV